MTRVQLELALRAFRAGFAAGATPGHKTKRHVVDPDTHKHWRRGFEAGRVAADSEETAYRKELSE